MGEAKRRKKLDPNYGKIRNPKYSRKIKARPEEVKKVMDLMSEGQFEEMARYIIDNNIYVPDRDTRKDIDWTSIEEVTKWAEECQKIAEQAAERARKELAMEGRK